MFSTSHNHRHGIGGKFDVKFGIKVVNCLYKTNATYLKKIVGIFAPVNEALNNTQYQPEIAVNQLLARFGIAYFGTEKQFVLFLGCQCGKFRSIDAANFNFVIIQYKTSPLVQYI